MAVGRNSLNKPAPKWLRITDAIIGDLEDTFLAVWLLTGHAADAQIMVIYKISSSFLRRQLKRFISNGEVYADISQIKESELDPVVEVKSVDNKINTGNFPDTSAVPKPKDS